jgi:RecA-family ATPase
MDNVITPNPASWLDFNTAADQILADNISSENIDIAVNDLGIKQYLDVLFGFLDEGFIPLRCFSESTKHQNAPYNIWVENDEHAASKVVNFANYCHSNKQACYLIPGLVSAEKQAKSADIIQMGVLLVDLDDGDIEAKLKHAIQFIGEPTLVVESGGTTLDGQAKLHAYWKLSEPVDQSDLESLLKLRAQLAQKIGGDTHFKSAHQPIRIAGSIHHKHGAREVTIRQHIENEYHLLDLDESVSGMPNINGIATPDQPEFLDFNTAVDKLANVNTALTTKVREGGQDDITRFESMSIAMGHYIRLAHSGHITTSECWDSVVGHNQMKLDPPWGIERVKLEANRLWEKHIAKNGPASDAANHEPQSLEWIDPTLWQGKPPEREWIIGQWLPKGYVTAIYGDGGVGKSLLVQQLMTSLATGLPWMDIMLKKQRVFGLLCEDDEDELWRRQEAINKAYGIGMKDLGNMRLMSRVGKSNLLMTFDGKDTGKLSEFFAELLEHVVDFQPSLVVLDTAADLFGGNENNRTQVRQFVQNACARIAREINGAVLLCAHPSDSGLSRGTGKGGSTAWNNTVRSRWYLKLHDDKQGTPGLRQLSRKKANYAAQGEEIYLSWEHGTLVTIDPEELEIETKRNPSLVEKTDVMRGTISRLIREEAAKGHAYTMSQFSQKYQFIDDLGSERGIKNELSEMANEQHIKFFRQVEGLGLPKTKNSHGYLWVDDYYFAVELDGENAFVEVQPTHIICSETGKCRPLNKGENDDELKP